MRPQARKAKVDGFPVPAADRTHVPVATKDFLSVLDLTHEELERVLNLAAELKLDRQEGRSLERRQGVARPGAEELQHRDRDLASTDQCFEREA